MKKNNIVMKILVGGVMSMLLFVVAWMLDTTTDLTTLIREIHGRVCIIEQSTADMRDDIGEIKRDLRE